MLSGAVPERSLPDLVETLRDDGVGRASLIDRVIAAARDHLEMDLSLLTEFRDGRQVYRRLAGDRESFGVRVGDGRPLGETYCKRVVDGELPPVVPDARGDAVTRRLAGAGIGAYVGVPVRLPDGELYGTLCCVSHDPDPTLRARDVRFLEVLAAVVGEELGRRRREEERRRRLSAEVAAALEASAIAVVFQPIVALEDGGLAGVEALASFTLPPRRSPERWFSDAWEVGLGDALELTAVRAALSHLERVPDGVYMSLNASPATVASPAFERALADVAPGRVLVEVTEHLVAEQPDVLAGAMARLRALGVRFAVDDAGAGYSGLNQMVRLAPDVIKLDRFLITGIDRDPARQALAFAAASFAARTRTRLIAEGIETATELATLRALGVGYGQGFHLGRPDALERAVKLRPPPL